LTKNANGSEQLRQAFTFIVKRRGCKNVSWRHTASCSRLVKLVDRKDMKPLIGADAGRYVGVAHQKMKTLTSEETLRDYHVELAEPQRRKLLNWRRDSEKLKAGV